MVEQVGIAMVGCGQIAEAHFKAVEAVPQARLVVAVDVDGDRAASAAERYGALRWSTDYAEVLSDSEVNAVVLCLPHDLHLPFSVQAARAGKHILVEKPMALSEVEAQEMVAAAESANVHLSVGQSTRFLAPIQKAKDLQKEGRIGRVINVLAQRTFWIEGLSTDWRREMEACGGLYLPLFGSHDIDAMLWLLDDTPHRVRGSIRAVSPVSGGDSDGVIGLDFADGKVASIGFATRCKQRRFEMVFVGEAGTMSVTRNGLQVDGEVVDVSEDAGAFELQMRGFVESLCAGAEPPTPGREVLRVMRVLDLVREASDRGVAIAF